MKYNSVCCLEHPTRGCYSPRNVSADSFAKALLIAVVHDPASALYSINRLTPELLCFFLPESEKNLVEAELQPHIAKLPRRWDSILTEDPHSFGKSHHALAKTLPGLLSTWEVHPGELVVDLTGATAGMAAAMALVSRPFTSQIVLLMEGEGLATTEGEPVTVSGRPRTWAQGNPWDEEASQARREAAAVFNQGAYRAAAGLFRKIESLISGGQKPLYHALGDLAEGYDLWEKFQYRAGWDKLKIALKALELVSVWGGPPGLSSMLSTVKANVGFLESVVLDPQDAKQTMGHDLLAHAKRRAEKDRNTDLAIPVLLRALEAFAQYQLWKQFRIKTWNVQVDQLPQALRESCRTCFLDDVDGKYKLPLHVQFRALAGLGDPMGQTFLAEWAKMKPLLDAAQQGVLSHGFEPIKAERFRQLYDIVMKLTKVNEASLPKFPSMNF